MKITKQRLKEIIKEELQREVSDAMDDAYHAGREIDKVAQPEPEADPMAGQLGTPEQQLLSRILARAVVDRYNSPEEFAAAYPDLEMTAELYSWIRYLKANPMFGSSGSHLEEAGEARPFTGRYMPGDIVKLKDSEDEETGRVLSSGPTRGTARRQGRPHAGVMVKWERRGLQRDVFEGDLTLVKRGN